MAEYQEFTVPDFLSDQTIDGIHDQMLNDIDDDIDKTEGSVAWDFTRPVATQKASAINFSLTEAIRQSFPMWAENENLDRLASLRGFSRKDAQYAAGEITVTGAPGTIIPDETVFYTEADDDGYKTGFESLDDAVIDSDGIATIPVMAVVEGESGNVAANRITEMAQPISGVETVTNPKTMTGGADEESDDSLRDRVLEYDQNYGVSFVGSLTDFKRWAEEVPGVGTAHCSSADDGSGEVTITLLTSTNAASDEALIKSVYDHIMSPDSPDERLAPINTVLIVKAPDVLTVTISAKIILDDEIEADIEDITDDFISKLKSYYTETVDEGIVRISKIGSLLLEVSGVEDYEDLKIAIKGNALQTKNLIVGLDQMPVTNVEDISLEVL